MTYTLAAQRKPGCSRGRRCAALWETPARSSTLRCMVYARQSIDAHVRKHKPKAGPEAAYRWIWL